MTYEQLRERRAASGITLVELAAKVGTTATQLSRLETGKRRLTYEWVGKINEALGWEEPAAKEALSPRWRVAECPAVNREARDALLSTGWEPFAVVGETMWLKRAG